jgi:hypothetical protein
VPSEDVIGAMKELLQILFFQYFWPSAFAGTYCLAVQIQDRKPSRSDGLAPVQTREFWQRNRQYLLTKR